MIDAGQDPPAPRPAKIRATHLQRLALLYIRQSSAAQVREHPGSAASQVDLKELLLQWGWPEARIRTIDEDQGVSSTSGATRTGSDGLLELLKAGEVGIIMGRELSRLARTPPDIINILWAAKTTATLIWDQGGLQDPANESIGEFFGLQIKGLFGSVENETRTYAAMASKIARARRGQPVTPAPIGYVRTDRGEWVKDPNHDIQDAVVRVFRLYRELGSLGKVVRELKRNQLLFPRRRRGEVTWRGLDAAHLHGILHNRAYCGDYVFSYKPLAGMDSPSSDGRRTRQHLVTENHHEPYVDRATWTAIQELLAAQKPSLRPMAGKGNALLQGLLRCQCRRWMRTQYWGRDGHARTATYVCRRIDPWGDETHRTTCPARFVDRDVVRAVLQALKPAEFEEALAMVEETLAAQRGVGHTQRRQLEAAEQAVEQARETYERAGSQHSRVQTDQLNRYETALEHRDRLKDAITASSTAPRITADDANELLRLCGQIDELWGASTTTNEDRKRLLRTVVSEIIVQGATRQAVDLEIVWHGGQRQPLHILRPRGVDAFVRDRTRAGRTAANIADELNAAGTLTASGRPVSTNVVHQKQGQQGIRLKHERLMARQIIHQELVRNTARPEILRRLQDQAPRLGPWTPQRLSDEIRRLREGVAGIEPLPTVLPAELEKNEVLEIIEQGINAFESLKTISARLNAAGLKPPRGSAFTPIQIRLLYMRSKGLTSLILPRRPSAPRD